MTTTIEGVVQLDGEPVEADLYLVDLAALTPVQSDAITGAYTFEDPGDYSVIPDSESLIVLCHYGTNIRPLAHGPVVPIFAAVIVDEYWDNVVLLLPFDEDLSDISGFDFAVSAGGNAAISATQSKFGGGAAYFDGTGDYLTALTLPLGTGDFTVDGWIRAGSVSSGWIFNQSSVGLKLSSGSLVWYEGGDECASATLSADTWYHFAASRESGTLRLFIDGVESSTDFSSSANISAASAKIGSDGSGGDFAGYIDDLRVTKGVARYTAGFTPPTQAYPTNANDPIDDWWEHVVLRLAFDGTDGSTTITDSSNSSHTITVSGNAQLDTAQFRNGAASCYFDGTSDTVLSIPHSVDLEFHTGDFTLELWFYRVASIEGAAVALLGKWDSGVNSANTSWALYFESGKLYFGVRKDSDNSFYGFSVASGLVNADFAGWVHIAVVRSGQYLRLFKNGVGYTQAGPITLALNSGTLPLIIGGIGSFADRGSYLSENNCYIDDLRITKGHARYTSDFIPPKRQLPIAAPVAVGDEHWASVVLLLSMNGTNGGTTFTDTSPSPKTITRYGDTCTKTDQWRFGGASAYFDGSGDYLSCSSPLIPATSDFTVEAWIRKAALGQGVIFAQKSAVADNLGRFGFQVNASNKLNVFLGDIGGCTGVSDIPANTWVHAAGVRHGSNLALYVNGVLENTADVGTGAVEQDAFFIGVYATSSYFNGYIDDLRVTSGVARYTADFTPPVRNFPNFGV